MNILTRRITPPKSATRKMSNYSRKAQAPTTKLKTESTSES